MTEDGGKSSQLCGGEFPVCTVIRLSIPPSFLHLIMSVCMHVYMCGVHACVSKFTVCVQVHVGVDAGSHSHLLLHFIL